MTHNLLFVRGVEALLSQCILLSLKSFELGLDIWVDEVGNVLSVVNLWHDIVFPRVVGENVMLWFMSAPYFVSLLVYTLTLCVDRVDTSTVGQVLLVVSLQSCPHWVLLVVLDL